MVFLGKEGSLENQSTEVKKLVLRLWSLEKLGVDEGEATQFVTDKSELGSFIVRHNGSVQLEDSEGGRVEKVVPDPVDHDCVSWDERVASKDEGMQSRGVLL